MISIQCSKIPCYLHQSSFYTSLSVEEKEEEIEIPERCFAQDDTVRNGQDFAQMLRVTAFWGLDAIPLSIIKYCHEDCLDWLELVREEHSEVPFGQDLLFIFVSPPIPIHSENEGMCADEFNVRLEDVECPLVLAIRRGRTEIVEYLALTPSVGTLATTTAAEMGRLNYLKLLHQHGHAWNESTCTQAMQGGHLECLRYLHENGCPWHIESLHYVAAAHSQLECLKYLLKQGVPWDDASIYMADNGNLEMLRYAAENGCPFDGNASYYAAAKGHTECLRYILFELRCPLHSSAMHEACFGGHLACIQLLHQYGAQWGTLESFSAARCGNISCIQYLHESGCPWDELTSQIAAARQGDYEMLHYVISHGCPYTPCILEDTLYAATAGGLKCFIYLLEIVRVPPREGISLFNEAFARGNHYILQYLFQTDPTCRSKVTLWPLQTKQTFLFLCQFRATDPTSSYDADMLKCIQCALENNWDIDTYGGALVLLIERERRIFPLTYDFVKPWYYKALRNNNSKESV